MQLPRPLQMRALLDAVDRLPPGIPVFMGDFNTNTYDGVGLEAQDIPSGNSIWACRPGMWRPASYCCPVAEEAGFSYWDCNDLVARTPQETLA